MRFRVAILFALPLLAQEKPAMSFSGSYQTGFASTFQLTLGGTFGEGPAWQNRLTLNINNVARKGDTVFIQGWDTFDTPSASNDWLAGIWYRPADFKFGRNAIQVTGGLQRWRFPSVGKGTQDWLGAATASWTARWKITPWAQAEFWDNFVSNWHSGQLLYIQAGTQHRLYQHDQFSLVFKHGAASTHSWGFYDKYGWRVVRYVALLSANWRDYTIEGGIRPQHALQPNIPENVYWSILFTRRF